MNRPRRLLVGAGAAAVIVSGALPWLRFERSELSGYRLAELVASVADEYRLGPPAWLGIVWYFLPLGALACWFVLLSGRPPAVRPSIHLPLGSAMAALSVAFTVAAQCTVGVQSGAVLSVVGSLVVMAGAAPVPSRRDRPAEGAG